MASDDTTDEEGFTNGYPDPRALRHSLLRRLKNARQQLSWCNRSDDIDGWQMVVDDLEDELAAMGIPA